MLKKKPLYHTCLVFFFFFGSMNEFENSKTVEEILVYKKMPYHEKNFYNQILCIQGFFLEERCHVLKILDSDKFA